MRLAPLILAATLAIPAAPALAAPQAPAAAPADKVVVVVAIPTPPGITEARLREEFAKAAPRYEQIPGLVRKYFTLGDGSFGGVYYWTSKAAADAWFNDAWRARVAATYHATAQVTYYTVPLAIDGKQP